MSGAPEQDCDLCHVTWSPPGGNSDIWGPSVASLQEMLIKTESHVFKPFKDASVDYANK